tara:strand:+ start:166 stop:708 length:543 start_codon:yes stop_codon:yes gene_type:complete
MSKYIERYQRYYRKGLYKTRETLVPVTDVHITQIIESLSKHPYMDKWELWLFGSKVNNDVSRDIDLFFTNDNSDISFQDTVEVVTLINETYRICTEELNIKSDVFHIGNKIPLLLPMTGDGTFSMYTTMDFDFEIEDGKVVRFIDFKLKGENGLYEVKMRQNYSKAVDRGEINRKLKRLI